MASKIPAQIPALPADAKLTSVTGPQASVKVRVLSVNKDEQSARVTSHGDTVTVWLGRVTF